MNLLLSSRIRGLLGVVLLAAAAHGRAEPAVSWPQALDAAWQRAAESSAVAADLRRATADQAIAGALWAAPPSIEIGHRTDRLQSGTGARETEIGLAVPLWLPGQREAQRGATSAGVAAAQRAEARARLALAGVLRDAVAQVELRRTEADQAAAEAQQLEALRMDVDRRVAAGDLARADALAAEAEWLAAQSRLVQAHEQRQRTELQWKRLTGLDALPLLPRARKDAELPPLESHPLWVDAAARVELARRKLALARQSGRSPPELVTRWRQDVGGRGDAAVDSLSIALRIPLGTADRNQPLLAAATAEVDTAEAQLRQLREQLASSIEEQRLALSAIERQMTDEQRRSDLLKQRAELIARSFKAGETSLPDMLRALSAAAQAEVGVRRLDAQRRHAVARLHQAMGMLP